MGQAKQRGSREARIVQAKARALAEAIAPVSSSSGDAFSSTAVKSTRRILFTHLYTSVEERGHWHVDQMYGSGTGILIKHERTYYLLTADHVIRNGCGYDFSNESPFWISSRADEWPTEMLGFLMPGRILHIGDLLAEQGVHLNSADLVLVELFYPPLPSFFPDHYIDLDADPNALLSFEEFIPGMPLMAAGYPFHANEFVFFEEERVDQMTHGTSVNRWIIDGLCAIEMGEPTIVRPGGKFPCLSGASGGIVTDFPVYPVLPRMAGLLLSAGPSVVRFIPSYWIANALAHKRTCRSTLVDPAFKGQPHPDVLAWMEELAKSLHTDTEHTN